MKENVPYLHYTKPELSERRANGGVHTFTLFDEQGDRITTGDVEYYSRPLPFYELSALITRALVNEKQGNAGLVLDQIEAFLVEKKKPGVLRNIIDKEHAAHDLYASRGWHRVMEPSGDELFVFNWPEGVPLRTIYNYEQRYKSRRPDDPIQD